MSINENNYLEFTYLITVADGDRGSSLIGVGCDFTVESTSEIGKRFCNRRRIELMLFFCDV
jgi:hypothetical protein